MAHGRVIHNAARGRIAASATGHVTEERGGHYFTMYTQVVVYPPKVFLTLRYHLAEQACGALGFGHCWQLARKTSDSNAFP